MDTDKLKILINQTIDQKLNSMSNLANSNHAHNGYDVNQLDPSVALLGFPVIQVTDATVNPIVTNPNDRPLSGTFRFYVDNVPTYMLWVYITYQNSSGVLVPAWKSVALT